MRSVPDIAYQYTSHDLPPPQALRFSHCTKPASAQRGGLVTKRKGPREGERREAKQGLALFFLLAFLCAQIFIERENC